MVRVGAEKCVDVPFMNRRALLDWMNLEHLYLHGIEYLGILRNVFVAKSEEIKINIYQWLFDT